MPHTDMESIDALRLLTADEERWRSTLRPLLAVLLADDDVAGTLSERVAVQV